MGPDSDNIHSAANDRIVQIDDEGNDYDMALIPEEALRDEFEKETRIFGFFQNGVICKMTMISHNKLNDKLNVDASDYYFWNGDLFYISETSSQFVEGMRKVNNLFFARYYFREGYLSDSILVGQDRFKEKGLDPGVSLLAEVDRNLQLIRDRGK